MACIVVTVVLVPVWYFVLTPRGQGLDCPAGLQLYFFLSLLLAIPVALFGQFALVPWFLYIGRHKVSISLAAICLSAFLLWTVSFWIEQSFLDAKFYSGLIVVELSRLLLPPMFSGIASGVLSRHFARGQT